jgi:hypothetical protein
MMPELFPVAIKVVKAFEQLGIPYLIGGSLASAVYGVVRTTMDADLVADVRVEHSQPLFELLKDEFYIDAQMIRNAVQKKSSFNLIHFETTYKVDVFILHERPFDLNRMQRRVLQPIGDLPSDHAFFSTAEDMILAKLEWFRAGGETSERQWRDILGMLDAQSEHLDLDYLHIWATSLSINDLLAKALAEARS